MTAVTPAAMHPAATRHVPPMASGCSSRPPRPGSGRGYGAAGRLMPRRTGSSTYLHEAAAMATQAAAVMTARVTLMPPLASAGAVSTMTG